MLAVTSRCIRVFLSLGTKENQMDPNSLLVLPTDVLRRIVYSMDLVDQVRLSRICKLIAQLVDEELGSMKVLPYDFFDDLSGNRLNLLSKFHAVEFVKTDPPRNKKTVRKVCNALARYCPRIRAFGYSSWTLKMVEWYIRGLRARGSDIHVDGVVISCKEIQSYCQLLKDMAPVEFDTDFRYWQEEDLLAEHLVNPEVCKVLKEKVKRLMTDFFNPNFLQLESITFLNVFPTLDQSQMELILSKLPHLHSLKIRVGFDVTPLLLNAKQKWLSLNLLLWPHPPEVLRLPIMLDAFLTQRGSQLTELSLDLSFETDMDVLDIVSRTCPRLGRLSLSMYKEECGLLDVEYYSVIGLWCIKAYSRENLLPLLYMFPRVREIRFYDEAQTSFATVYDWIQQLKSFANDRKRKLTAKFAQPEGSRRYHHIDQYLEVVFLVVD